MRHFLLQHPIEKIITLACLAALIPLMLAAATARHLFPPYHPLALEAATGCLVWLTAFAIPLAAASGMHQNIDCLKNAFRPGIRRYFVMVANGVFLLFAAAALISGTHLFILALGHQNPPTHPVVYLAVPPAAFLTIVRLLARLRASPEKAA